MAILFIHMDCTCIMPGGHIELLDELHSLIRKLRV